MHGDGFLPPTFREERILAALLAASQRSEYERLLPKLEHVISKSGEIVYRADQKIEHVYFPEEAVVAMIDSMDDGRIVEVGMRMISLGSAQDSDHSVR